METHCSPRYLFVKVCSVALTCLEFRRGSAQLNLLPLTIATLPAGPGRSGVLPPAVQRGVLPPADPVLPALCQPRVQGDQGVLHQPGAARTLSCWAVVWSESSADQVTL